MVIVDGKQRLEAIRKFLRGELKAFGYYIQEFEDYKNKEGKIVLSYKYELIFHINDLQTRKEVLQWYLDLNAGGVVHTPEELDKVRKLLEAER